MIYFILIAAVVALDQLFKLIVVGCLGMMKSVPVIKDFFYINCVPNDGIALGMMSGKQTAVIIMTAVIMIALSVVLVRGRKKNGPFLSFCLCLIIGGGIGNLIDRIRLGYVVDFLEFRVWSYIFNFADVCVVAGCFLLLFFVAFENKLKKPGGTKQNGQSSGETDAKQ